MLIPILFTRFRPFNRLEVENGSTECIDVLDEHTVKMKTGTEADGKLVMAQ
jgi:hypothetical protein